MLIKKQTPRLTKKQIPGLTKKQIPGLTKKQIPRLTKSQKKQQRSIQSMENLKNAQPSQFCLVHVNKTKNNLHCVVSTLFGQHKTLWSVSGGHVIGSRTNSRRKTRLAQRTVYKATIEKILALGARFLVMHCRGTIPSKRFIMKTFNKHLTIVIFKDVTSVAHNGTKPPSSRRL